MADAVVVGETRDESLSEFGDREPAREQQRLAGQRLLHLGGDRVVPLHVADLIGQFDRRDASDRADDPADLRVELLRAGDREQVGREAVAAAPAHRSDEHRDDERDDVEQHRARVEDVASLVDDDGVQQADRVEVRTDRADTEQERQAELDTLAGVPAVDECRQSGDCEHPERVARELEQCLSERRVDAERRHGHLSRRRVGNADRRGDRGDRRRDAHATTSTKRARSSRVPTANRSSPAWSSVPPSGASCQPLLPVAGRTASTATP